MSGCLTRHRPDICSTTSFESIRTSTDACGSIRATARRPAIRPEYSATLLVATPSDSDSSARTSPVAASRTRAPYPAGPGFPRDPPSASTISVRIPVPPSQARFGRADQNPPALLAAEHVVGGGRPDPVEVDRVEGQVASLAAPAAQHGRPDAVLVAQLVVEREHVGGHVGGNGRAARLRLGGLSVDLLQRRVALGRQF